MSEVKAKFDVRNLNLHYGAFHALKDINMKIGQNEITALIGPSGCGKSTFLKTLNRMQDFVPDVKIDGEIIMDHQDIFRDMDGIRQASITVAISRSWTEADGTEHTEVVPGYENYVIKGDISKSTWQEIIKSEKPDKLLPAYKKDTDGTLHYYKYSVTETEIEGYTTTIKSSDDGFTFTIINRHFALLPDTGGEGIMMFIIAGGLLLAFLLYTGRRRKRKQTM